MDRESFTRDLAQALLDAETRPLRSADEQQQQHDLEELLQQTYHNLCHDYPEPMSVSGIRLLQHALIDPDSPYALSPRLVNGIHQFSSTTTPIPSTSTQNDEESNPHNDEPLFQRRVMNDKSSLPSTFAHLAWTVHVHIPLLCCRTNDLSEISRYLGSYLVSVVASNSSHPPFDVDTQTESFVRRNEDMQNGNHHHLPCNRTNALDDSVDALNEHHLDEEVTNNKAADNGLAEIFAENSDDSDFEFESEWNPVQQVVALDRWVSLVEESWTPLELSKPMENVTWNTVASTVTALLESYTYSLIASLTEHQWQSMKLSDHTTQLVLALLVPSASQDSQMLTVPEYTEDHWRCLGLHVLHVFRDLILHKLTSNESSPATTNKISMLEDYLRILHILMQANHTDVGVKTVSASGIKRVTEPAVLVSVSSMSAICSEILATKLEKSGSTFTHWYVLNEPIIKTLQSSIAESFDDLVVLLEASLEMADDHRLSLQWTYLALFQILCIGKTSPAVEAAVMLPSIAQTLLNSGLFRQWLLLWIGTTIDSDCRAAMQSCILDCCLASPTLLGKYAWRFPGLAEQVIVSTPQISESDCYRSLLPTFLWNLFGIHLESSLVSASIPIIQWKSKSNTNSDGETEIKSRIITAETCQQTAWSIFQAMCQTALQILTEWKVRRENRMDARLGDSFKWMRQKEILKDFGRLTDRLSSPFLRTLFVEKVMLPQIVQTRNELLIFQPILAQWSSLFTKGKAVPKPDFEDTNEEEKETLKQISPEKELLHTFEEDECVASFRKHIKSLLLFVDEIGCTDGPVRVTINSTTSKTD